MCYVSTGLSPSSTQLSDLTDDIIQRHRHIAQSLTSADMHEILFYTLNKLLKAKTTPKQANTPVDEASHGHITANNNVNSCNNSSSAVTHVPAIHLKIFYQVSAQPSIDVITSTLDAFRQQTSNQAILSCTVLPACSLQNFSTFISICGIRHE